MIRAIARQAEAERGRRAKIIDAEGELQAAQRFMEAARILASQPQAMQLRYLTTLQGMATDRSSMIVFPLPLDLISGFRGGAAAGGPGRGGGRAGGWPSIIIPRVEGGARDASPRGAPYRAARPPPPGGGTPQPGGGGGASRPKKTLEGKGPSGHDRQPGRDDLRPRQPFHGGCRRIPAVSRHLRKRLPEFDVESGFLEFARPVIRDGLEALKARGARGSSACPACCSPPATSRTTFLRDQRLRRREPGDRRHVRPRAGDRRQAAARGGRPHRRRRGRLRATGPRQETLLMVVGRGTNDPDANANVAKVARMLWEGMGFGWTEVAIPASPIRWSTRAAARGRARLPADHRLPVLPVHRHPGRADLRHADACQAAHPEIEIVKADYLNDHPLVIDTFVERLDEALNGANLMNCLLCKYREQVLGYEADQGAPQVGHHYHVRGIGTDHRAHPPSSPRA